MHKACEIRAPCNPACNSECNLGYYNQYSINVKDLKLKGGKYQHALLGCVAFNSNPKDAVIDQSIVDVTAIYGTSNVAVIVTNTHCTTNIYFFYFEK